MATLLTRVVRRQVDAREVARRPLIVEWHPGGMIVLREKGRRVKYSVTLAWVFVQAAKAFALAQQKERQLAKVMRRKARAAERKVR